MADPKLIERTAAALRDHGLTVETLRAPKKAQGFRPDGWLRVRAGAGRVDYVVEAKRRLAPAMVGAALTQLKHAAEATAHPALLITDYVTPPLAEKLLAAGQQFADAAGNAYLQAPGLLVHVQGRKQQLPLTTAPIGQAFTPAGLKLLFALICEPELADAPHRQIAAAAGVALGAVPPILAALQQTGQLLVAGKRRRLNATKRLIDEWALAYAGRLRGKTLQGTYVTQNFDTWRDWQLDPMAARWGGEPAANLLVRHLRPGVLTIYAEKLPPKLVVQQRLTAATPGVHERTLELRKPFWGKELAAAPRLNIVPAPLIYADLLATGDGRCIETAQIVYEGHLARLFPAA